MTEGSRGLWCEALRGWVAILAAWAVVMAAVAPAPAFAHPAGPGSLCLSDGVVPTADGLPGSAPDDHVHPCCLIGGPSVAAVPPQGAVEAAPVTDTVAVEVSRPFRLPSRPASPECHPQAPRAPPTS